MSEFGLHKTLSRFTGRDEWAKWGTSINFYKKYFEQEYLKSFKYLFIISRLK